MLLRSQPLQNVMDLATPVLILLAESVSSFADLLCLVLEFLFQSLQNWMRQSLATERAESPPWRRSTKQLLQSIAYTLTKLLQSIAYTLTTLSSWLNTLKDALWAQAHVTEHCLA